MTYPTIPTTQATQGFPTIPEVVWASNPQEIIHQFTMCAYCGPDNIPTRVFYIKGTSVCSQHAKELYDLGGLL